VKREKTLELARYAGFGTQYTNGQPHIWGGEMETQKLDVLIEGVVNECVRIIQMQMTRGKRDEVYKSQIESVKAIREYFGVDNESSDQTQ
jgi:hypothetical protein